MKINENNTISINCFGNDETIENSTTNWLRNVLFPKFVKWCNESGPIIKTVESLSQISIEEYNELYNKLKEKYGTHMVKVIFNLKIKINKLF